MVLPLSGHDFGISTRDVDLGVQAGLVVGLDNVSAEDFAGTYTTVVWALGSGESVLGPAIWPAKFVEKGVFLLKTEPELVCGVLLEDDGSVVAEVVCVGLAIRHVRLAHDKNVVTLSEWIGVVGDRTEVDIRVFAGCLAC